MYIFSVLTLIEPLAILCFCHFFIINFVFIFISVLAILVLQVILVVILF